MTSTAASQTLHRTPFHQYHVKHGARMVEFVGWEMPMLYRSIMEEHRQVRTSGGMFDVSHMGRLSFHGRDARRFLDRVCTRQIFGMTDGQCRYSVVCNERGGCRDDTLVYRMGEQQYLMVCNAANREKLLEHFAAERGDLEFDLRDETFDTAMLAIQGPRVMDLIGRFAPDVAQLKRYRFTVKEVLGAKVVISRTGYTGEDGVEGILPAHLHPHDHERVFLRLDSDRPQIYHQQHRKRYREAPQRRDDRHGQDQRREYAPDVSPGHVRVRDASHARARDRSSAAPARRRWRAP